LPIFITAMPAGAIKMGWRATIYCDRPISK
jgi:hypothetical protein